MGHQCDQEAYQPSIGQTSWQMLTVVVTEAQVTKALWSILDMANGLNQVPAGPLGRKDSILYTRLDALAAQNRLRDWT